MLKQIHKSVLSSARQLKVKSQLESHVEQSGGPGAWIAKAKPNQNKNYQKHARG